MARVALISCTSYDDADAAVTAALDLVGAGALFAPDEKILLKPNLRTKATADGAVTTHPAVFAATAKYLRAHGCADLAYGDSPGRGSVETAAHACGIADAAAALGIRAADFSGGRTVPYPDGRTAKEFILANDVPSFDAIVNICKMKTHMLERITGAQKNLFGCVFGLNKGASHVKFPNAERFACMLADLNRMLRPRLHVMDGVVAMEGNGPQSGTPTPMHVILASTDPVALDTVFAALVYLDPALVPTNVIGAKYGVGEGDPAKIEVVTADGVLTVEAAQQKYGNPHFDVYRGRADKGEIKQLRPFRRLLAQRPRIDAKKCVRCGVCVRSCPVEGGAIHFKKDGKPPVYDYQKCIRCYCCQEMCPKKAIYNYRNPLTKIADVKFKV